MIFGKESTKPATPAQRSFLLDLLERSGFDRDRVRADLKDHRVIRCEAPVGSSVESWAKTLTLSRAARLIQHLNG